MLGYWNNPEATNAIIDADGWLNTAMWCASVNRAYLYHRAHQGNNRHVEREKIRQRYGAGDPARSPVRSGHYNREARPYLVALVVLNARHGNLLPEKSACAPICRKR